MGKADMELNTPEQPKVDENATLDALVKMRAIGTRNFAYSYNVFKTLFEDWKRLKEESRWIPVSERFPKPDSAVLVVNYGTAQNSTFHGRNDVFEAYFSEHSQFLEIGQQEEKIENRYWSVTHWMKLPAPPTPTSDLPSTSNAKNKNG